MGCAFMRPRVSIATVRAAVACCVVGSPIYGCGGLVTTGGPAAADASSDSLTQDRRDSGSTARDSSHEDDAPSDTSIADHAASDRMSGDGSADGGCRTAADCPPGDVCASYSCWPSYPPYCITPSNACVPNPCGSGPILCMAPWFGDASCGMGACEGYDGCSANTEAGVIGCWHYG